MATRFNEKSHYIKGRFAYQVFLSFRGADVRKGFLDHLHHALVQRGIQTFHDDSALERGEDIPTKLYEAIERSELSIVTFTSGYATSRWCLDELVKIMECRTSFGHFVLPVFYDVDPSVVRKQSGLYKQAFDAHEVRFKDDLQRVQMWRAALRDAANLAGFHLPNQANVREAGFIQMIVKEIVKKIDRRKLIVPRNVVGVESVVGDVSKWLLDGSNEVGVGVISGLGGVGKTTIAKIVYNNNSDNFDGYSFLSDIKRVSQGDGGFVDLQRQLISNILRDQVGEIYNISQGMVKISEVIGSRRILLVLDDVDELEQLCGMFDDPEMFCPGSKIIITTRNQHLQSVQMSVKQFQVCTLNDDRATQLFCLLAFGQKHPLQPYVKVVQQFVQYCGGLPLALDVLASSLCEKPLDLWESQLAKLENFPNRKVHDVLKLSFESIEDDNDKDIFLHIAFFLVGLNVSYTFTILEGCGLYTRIGFQNLVDRGLVMIDYKHNANVVMHQLIQEMGRGVVRQEASNEPGKRSRLWNHKEIINVLQNNEGTAAVKGLRLEFPAQNSIKITKGIYTKAEYLPKRFGLASILPTQLKHVRTSLQSVKTEAFSVMKNLNLLQLKNVQLEGSFVDFPKALTCFWWEGCPLESLPGGFDFCELVVMDMRNSSLLHAWEGMKFLGALKIINLSNSPFLIDTPDFTSALVLEWIILTDCISLVRIHESIGGLKNLVNLNLKGCKNLCGFPKSMAELCSLKILNLSGCSHLLKVPGNIESAIIRVTCPVTRHGSMVGRSETLSLPGGVQIAPRVSFSLFPQLETLILAKCDISDDTIFDYFSCLSSLQFLDLSENPLSRIDKNLGHFTQMLHISLKNCANLQSVSPIPAICAVTVQGCLSLETVEYLHSQSSYAYDNGCVKHVENGGLVTLEWTRTMGADRANFLGYPDLQSYGGGKQMLHGTSRGLYHCGTYSVFLLGDHTAKWFTEIIVCLELNYVVPSIPDRKIRALNLSCVYECDRDFDTILCLEIINVSRNWEWKYYQSIHPIYQADCEGRNVTLLAHWCVMEDRELKAGDALKIVVSLDHGGGVPIKYGIKILYEEEEEMEFCENSTRNVAMQEEESGAVVEEKLSLAVWYHNMFVKNIDLSLLEDSEQKESYYLEEGDSEQQTVVNNHGLIKVTGSFLKLYVG